MDYSAWRITFQSAEQAARSAFARVNYLHGGNVMLQSECERLNEALDRVRRSRDFYMRRCEALQAVQDKMRDPERKAVCDILANGSTTALDPVDRSHEYAQSKEHGGCSQCGYPEWEPWHRREVGAND